MNDLDSNCRRLGILILAMGLSACAKPSRPPPPPCRIGVDAAVCGSGVKSRSSWSESFILPQFDPKSGQRVVNRRVRMAYEFSPDSAAPRWRRMISVDSGVDRRGMFQEGSVDIIGPDQIELRSTRSSCDDIFFSWPMPARAKMFYQRVGGTLALSQRPFTYVPSQDWSNDPTMAGLETSIDSFYFELVDLFTLGSARRIMNLGYATLHAQPVASAQNFDGVSWGCFSSIGRGFSKSNLTPGW